jgi:predicted enzyme related to lactoylglutathione lyase
MSKDPAGVAAFYEKLFGWNIDYVREIDYRIVNTGRGKRHQRRHREAGS